MLNHKLFIVGFGVQLSICYLSPLLSG